MGSLTLRKMANTFVIFVAVAIAFCATAVYGQQKNIRPAFSVGLTYNVSFSDSTPENVKYDRVFLDTTSSYNPATGIYTVPVSGEYVVMVHALAEFDGTLWLELTKNNDYMFSAYSHVTADYGSASNAGVISFNQGDTMHVVGRGSSILYGLSDELYCTFSAYLLAERK